MFKLIVLLLLLMIATDMQALRSRVILAVHLIFSSFFPFQIIIRKVANLILEWLLLIWFDVLINIVHIRTGDYVVGVLNQVLVTVWINSILWSGPDLVLLVLFFRQILSMRLILVVTLHHTARPVFIHVEFIWLLVWVLACRRIWNLLRQ